MRYESISVDRITAWSMLNDVGLLAVSVSSDIRDDQGCSKGGGLVATKDCSPDETLLRVPPTLVLSGSQVDEQAKSDVHLRQVLEAVGPVFAQNIRKKILIFLLLQITHSSPDIEGKGIGVSCPLTDYVKLLPKSIPLPTFYTEEEQELLTGTSLSDALGQKLKSLEEEFQHLRDATENIPWCQETWWSEDGRENTLLRIDDWHLVDAMYRSRALELPGAIGHAMVPVLDMANHAGDLDCNARFDIDNRGNVTLAVRDGKQILEGEEITIMYGQGGACEMIFSYGFLDDKMEIAREIFLDLDVPSDDPLATAKKRFAQEAPGMRLFQHDDKSVRWESPFVWWSCVNEEDGLDFDVVQLVDGERELQATWKNVKLNPSDNLEIILGEDPQKDVFSLRATVLVQQRVEEQGQILSTVYDLPDIGTNERQKVGDTTLNLIRKLRGLELQTLMLGFQTLESEKMRLLELDSVRTYLQAGHDPNPDFSEEIEEIEDFS